MSEISFTRIKQLVESRSKSDGTILEIGSNAGEDTSKLLSSCRKARVYCFECDPRAIERWKRAIRARQRVDLYEVALADVSGPKTFYPSGGQAPGSKWRKYFPWDKSGSLLEFDRHKENAPWMEHLDPITVQCTTLDEWAAEHLERRQPIDFVWMDVQGAEHLVLKGASETIRRIRYIYCECDSRPNYKGQAKLDDLKAALPGFELIDTFSYNVLFENREYRLPPKEDAMPVVQSRPARPSKQPPRGRVEVKSMGQIGNQMFAYCMGKIAASITGLEYTPPEQFVNKAGKPVTWTGPPLFTMEPTAPVDRPKPGPPLSILAAQWFDIETLKGATGVSIECYMQRYELFKAWKDQIRHNWLRIRRPFVRTDPDAVYIHARRDDYIPSTTNPLRQGHVGIATTMDEYAACLKEFPDANRIVIATDSPDDPFFREFGQLGLPYEISRQPWDEDFLMLASADNLIMSQSTYSWWAGFLGRCKKIVCPCYPTSFYHNGLLSREFPNLYVDDEPDRWTWVGIDAVDYPIARRASGLSPAEVRMITGTGDPVFLEIGANEGDTTKLFLDEFPAGHFYCCECDPRALGKFHLNIPHDRTTITNCAIADISGYMDFYPSGGGPGGQWDKSGSLCKPTGHLERSPEITFSKPIKVRTMMLDEWAELLLPPSVERIDFIWIDVQGAELKVFEHGINTLAKTRWVYAECHDTELYDGQPSESEMRAFFKGWTCMGRFGDDLLFRNDSIEHSFPAISS